jgi:hypothetical protein
MAERSPTMTAEAKPATKAEKPLYEYTSQDHAEKCPQHAWQRATKDQQQDYLKKNKGQQPKCANVEGECCPDDIVINAGVQTLFIGGAGGDKPMSIGADPPRMDVGDRRRGPYYLDLCRKGIMPGLQQVKRVAIARLADLEKTRQIREGERPADWILKARARAQKGEGPAIFSDKRTAMTELQQAAGMPADPENDIGPGMNPLAGLGGDGHGH